MRFHQTATLIWAFPLAVQAAIVPSSGDYIHNITDYQSTAEPALSLIRSYRSSNAYGVVQTPAKTLGASGWGMPFLIEKLIITQPYTVGVNTYGPYYDYPPPSYTQTGPYYKTQNFTWPGHAIIYIADGSVVALRQDTINGPWYVLGDTKTTVTCNAPGQGSVSVAPGPTDWGLVSSNRQINTCASYTINWADGKLQTFSRLVNGNVYKLSSFTLPGGWSATLAYDSDGNLTRVTSAGGRVLNFAYNSSGNVSQITAPGNYTLNYSYDANGNLAAVTGPGSLGERYKYQNTNSSWLLTEVDDLNGNLIEGITYDANKKAIQVQGPNGIGKTTLQDKGNGNRVLTDPTGVALTYYFNNYGLNQYLPDSINRADGASKSYSYDQQGRLLSESDFAGNAISYSYNTAGTQTTTSYPNGLVKTTSTASNRSYPQQETTPFNGTSYTYDSHGNVLSKTLSSNGKSLVWSYAYDSAGRVTSTTDLSTGTVTYTYDASGALSTMVNALGHTWRITSVDPHGNPLSISTPAGDLITYTYDAALRLKSQSFNDAQTTYSYTPHGKLASIARPDGSTVNFAYNAADQLSGISNTNGASISYSLDNAGRPSTVTQSNATGQVTSQTYRYNSSSGYLSAIVNGLNNTTSITTDYNGNITGRTDALNRQTTYNYDGINALVNTTWPDGNAIANYYDLLGNLTGIYTPDGQYTNYTVNGLSQTTAQSSPDTGNTSYTYDSAGRLKTRTDARGKVATYTYDAIGRTTGIAYSGGPTIAYAYDSPRIGSLSSISGGGATLSYGYDSLGRVSSLSQTVGSITKTIAYQRDAAGKLMSLTTPSGQVVSFAYASGSSQPSALNINGAPVISQFVWLPFKNAPQGWQWANGANHVRAVDAAGRTSWVSTDNVLSRQLTLDAAGNISAIADALLAERSQTFGYDALDQLIGETGSAGRNYAYGYDSNGNRVSWLQDAGGTASVTPGYSGNILSSLYVTPAGTTKSVTHDAAGNLLNDGTRTYTYDGRGRLITVKKGTQTTTYQYNGLGQRVSKTGMLFMYDLDGHLLGEYDASGNLIEETVWLGDLPVATLRPNGAGVAVYYVNPDELGSPRVVTDTGNQPVWRWDSDAFGNGAPNEDPRGTGSKFSYNLRFPGQYLDKESGLHYNYYRDYDPATGRYIQSDPIGLQGGTNTYTYVGENPVSRIDPLGLETIILVPMREVGTFVAALTYPDTPGILTIISHGNPLTVNNKTPEQLAKLITDLPSWQAGDKRPILLNACKTGAGGNDSYAAKLAKLLGVTVIAPDTAVWNVGPKDIGPFYPTDSGNAPNLLKPGRWLTF